MLDYLAIFTKGGALLWAWQLGQLRGDPVGALIRGCLLEDRAGERAFAYALPGGAGYTVKWSLHNVRRETQMQPDSFSHCPPFTINYSASTCAD